MNDYIREYSHKIPPIAGSLCRKVYYTVDVNDLISAGYDGLAEASNKFTTKRNVDFWVYASRIVVGRMIDMIRLSIYKSKHECEMFVSQSHTICFEDSIIRQEMIHEMWMYLATILKPKEFLVWQLRFIYEKPYDEIGKQIGVTGIRCYQIFENGRLRLRKKGIYVDALKLRAVH